MAKLVGDKRRHKIVEELKVRQQRDSLEHQLNALRERLSAARSIRDPFDRRLTMSAIAQRLNAVHADYEMTRARAASLRRELEAT